MNCANLSAGSDRMHKGGRYASNASNTELRSAGRDRDPPLDHAPHTGVRCARVP
jgi:hypothetical protein